MDMTNLYEELTTSSTEATAYVATVAESLRALLSVAPNESSAALAAMGQLAGDNNYVLLGNIVGAGTVDLARAEYNEAQRVNNSRGTSMTILFKDFRTCPLFVPTSTESDEDDFL